MHEANKYEFLLCLIKPQSEIILSSLRKIRNCTIQQWEKFCSHVVPLKKALQFGCEFSQVAFLLRCKAKIYLWLYCSEPKKCSNYNKPMPPTCWNKVRTCCYLFRSIYNMDKWDEILPYRARPRSELPDIELFKATHSHKSGILVSSSLMVWGRIFYGWYK